MARNANFAAFAEQVSWNGVCLSKRVGSLGFGNAVKTRLYIFVLSAILIAPWSAAVPAESEKSGQTGKKKMKVILVAKKNHDRSGRSGKTEGPRPENHSQR